MVCLRIAVWFKQRVGLNPFETTAGSPVTFKGDLPARRETLIWAGWYNILLCLDRWCLVVEWSSERLQSVNGLFFVFHLFFIYSSESSEEISKSCVLDLLIYFLALHFHLCIRINYYHWHTNITRTFF